MHTDVIIGAVDDVLCMVCVTETINSRTELVDTTLTHQCLLMKVFHFKTTKVDHTGSCLDYTPLLYACVCLCVW